MIWWVVPLVSAAVGAMVGALLGIYVQDFVLKPVLEVENVDDVFYSPHSRSNHHRLRIRNVGLRAVTNCTAALTVRDIVRNDVAPVEAAILGPGSFDDQPRPILEQGLCWAQIGNPASITINKKAHQGLNFYYVPVQQPALQRIFVYSEDAGIRIVLIASKVYEGQILITASNANPRWVSFRLEPSDEDVNLRITQVRPRLWPPFIRYFIPGQ